MSVAVAAPLIANPAYAMLLDALAGLRNGLVFGTKIRAPHTFVLQMVWSRNSTWLQTLEKMRDLSLQHGLNLGKAALVFKLGTHLLKLAQGGETAIWHHTLMGAISGFLFWGEATPVNMQVNFYVMSRVLSALLFLYIEHRTGSAGGGKKGASAVPPLSPTESWLYQPSNGSRVLSSLIWAAALYLFFNHGHLLQSGLRQSMQYIYKDGDKHEGSLKRVLLGATEVVKASNTSSSSSSSSPTNNNNTTVPSAAAATAAEEELATTGTMAPQMPMTE